LSGGQTAIVFQKSRSDERSQIIEIEQVRNKIRFEYGAFATPGIARAAAKIAVADPAFERFEYERVAGVAKSPLQPVGRRLRQIERSKPLQIGEACPRDVDVEIDSVDIGCAYGARGSSG
jgi:hypothetical protein